jgi:hypothetical protein
MCFHSDADQIQKSKACLWGGSGNLRLSVNKAVCKIQVP